MSNNGIARAEDFRKAAEELNPPERVVLPKSGLPVLLRRPTSFACWLLDERLAQLEASGLWSEYRDTMKAAVMAAMVAPKLSLAPREGEIHPNSLPEDDQKFILRWARGLVTRDGTDLVEKFFREQRDRAQAGAGGGDVALPAKQPAGTPGRGGAAG